MQRVSFCADGHATWRLRGVVLRSHVTSLTASSWRHRLVLSVLMLTILNCHSNHSRNGQPQVGGDRAEAFREDPASHLYYLHRISPWPLCVASTERSPSEACLRAGAAFECPTHSIASTPTRQATAGGNGSSPRKTGGSIPRQGNKVAITLTNHWFRKPSETPLRRQV